MSWVRSSSPAPSFTPSRPPPSSVRSLGHGAFLGGAISAHVRLGELGSPPELVSLVLGAMTWGGLYTRDPCIRALLPLVR